MNKGNVHISTQMHGITETLRSPRRTYVENHKLQVCLYVKPSTKWHIIIIHTCMIQIKLNEKTVP